MSEFLDQTEYDVINGHSEKRHLGTDGVYGPYISEDVVNTPKTERRRKTVPNIEGQVSIDDIFVVEKAKEEKNRTLEELKKEFGDILTEQDKNPNEETRGNAMMIACRRNKRKSRFDRQLDAFYAK